MERAHVLVRLRGEASASASSALGICRTSATTVRLEHSEMSPGVASITFEQVFDVCDSNSRVFQTSLTPAIDAVMEGKGVTLVATGATSSGKSFACHGDQQKPSNGKAEPGLITLAIRRVFSGLQRKLENGRKCNVLLSCWGVGRSGTSVNEALTDLLATGKYVEVPVEDMENVMVEHSVQVTTPAEAVHVYSRALGRVNHAEKQDFVFALHVETLSPSGDARRGRLLVVDVHEGSIVESRGAEIEKTERGQDYFLDTQFPVNKVLSAGFGAFVGNTSSTYLLVAIQTPAQFQQQAIQSLLYACKAKEIKSTSTVNYLAAFVEKNSPHQLMEAQNRQTLETGNQTPGCREDYIAPKAPDLASSADLCTAFFSSRSLPPVSPPMSTTSSDSTYELPLLALPSQIGDEPATSLSLSANTSCESEGSQKQAVVSRRVRKAYDLAKAATNSPAKQSVAFTANSNESGEGVVHAALDELLKNLPRDKIRGLSLRAKLEQIRTTQAELERALVHETSIKDKCVDRISRMSQTMSCQIVEQNQQLHEALTAKHAAEAQLQDLHLKFDDVGCEVSRLQEEIKALKAGKDDKGDSVDARSCASENDRVMLHTLSARLEEAMIQAKDVITFKDGVIKSLEERLQLASKRGADAVTMLEEESGRFEREKAELLAQLVRSEESGNIMKNEEVSRVQAQNLVVQHQKAELTVKVAQLTLELETARSQWVQDAHAREDRADLRCAKQVAQAEQQLEHATAAMQQQMAQFRIELDMKVARQRVATQAACKAGELKCDQLERDLQRTKLKLVKQKVKLEKKACALVANAHRQHEQPVVELQSKLEELSARLETVLEREQDALRRARVSEETVQRVKREVQQLEASAAEVERERSALRTLCKDLEADKAALKVEHEHRIHEMEHSLAIQVMAAEVRINEERDRQMQKLMEQHSAEISRLKAITVAKADKVKEVPTPTKLASQQSTSPRVSSSGEEGSLSSDSTHLQSIEELDALIDSKERRYRHFEKLKKTDSASQPLSSPVPTKSSSSSFKRALAHKAEQIAELSARQKHLLAALATANEQETLAKRQTQVVEARCQQELARYEELLQQLNSVKQENWNLSLALHVTETTTQQQQRKPPTPNPMY